MLNIFRQSKQLENITCPKCHEEQEVNSSSMSVFCKNCRARIDIKNIKQKPSSQSAQTHWKPKTKTISCPLCHSLQDVLATALSAYCKNCNQRITIKEDSNSEIGKTMPTGVQKEIICPHCGSHENVPSTALSTFCSECGNRINLQNYEIRGRFRGDLDTKGTVYIADDGFVEGNINTGSLIVSGKFKGDVIADEKVEMRPTAKLYGKITSPALIASSGSIFVGHLHIGK